MQNVSAKESFDILPSVIDFYEKNSSQVLDKNKSLAIKLRESEEIHNDLLDQQRNNNPSRSRLLCNIKNRVISIRCYLNFHFIIISYIISLISIDSELFY